MELRITTLSENTARTGDYLAEWGLSILVETEGVNILLDTGRSISASHNADILGIDLSTIDKIVLSHGHRDHTGGLRQILSKMRKEIEIIAHPDIWAAKYARRQEEADRYIGIPFRRQELEWLGASFKLTTKPVKISGSIMTIGEIPMVTDYEKVDPDLFVKEDNGCQPDKLLDDQALILNTEQGLVIILGCAHRGIMNTLYHTQQLTGVKKVHTVLGGSHLSYTSEEQIWSTIPALRDTGVQKLGLCHCTGLSVSTLLAQEFGDSFFFNNAGTSLELP
ncbi:MBL fold metallo-hydrolase [Chloroflexota bacterium]